MGLKKLPPEWQYYIFREIVKERKNDKKKKRRRSDRKVERRGSLLERDVARIFSLIGLKPALNVRLNGHEIDVLVTCGDKRLAIECKQYESGKLEIRDLIYEWATKSRELGFDKVLLVIVGCEVKPAEKELANKYGIAIWDEKDFEKFFTKAIERREEARDEILESIGFEPSEASLRPLEPLIEEVPHVAGLSFYEAMKSITALWIIFGWILAGLIASFTPLTFSQSISIWLVMGIVLAIVIICLKIWIDEEKAQTVLKVLTYASDKYGGLTLWQLARVLNMDEKNIEKILNSLKKKRKVELSGSRWKVMTAL